MSILQVPSALLFSAACLFLFATAASARLNCDNIAGQWAGTMKGAYNGQTSMAVTGNCRVTWALPDGRTNNCRYSSRNGNIEYSCSLGSRGSVAFEGGKIIMRNIYTAGRDGAYTVTVSKR